MQVLLIRSTLKRVSKLVTALSQHASALSSKPNDSGKPLLTSLTEAPSPLEQRAPSHLSSPSPSTFTRSTSHPVGSDGSTGSFVLLHGLPSMWVQVLIQKLVLSLYVREESLDKPHGSSSVLSQVIAEDDKVIINFDRYDLESGIDAHDLPTGESPLVDHLNETPSDISRGALVDTRKGVVKLSFEADGLSLQLDVQEKFADAVFKVATMKCSMLKKEQTSEAQSSTLSKDSRVPFLTNQWVPYISNSNGKLFSSSRSVLPEGHSKLVPPPVSSLSSQQLSTMHDSPKRQSPKRHSNFFQVKVTVPLQHSHRAVHICCDVCPFEAVAWLPALQVVVDITSSDKDNAQKVSLSVCRCSGRSRGVHGCH